MSCSAFVVHITPARPEKLHACMQSRLLATVNKPYPLFADIVQIYTFMAISIHNTVVTR